MARKVQYSDYCKTWKVISDFDQACSVSYEFDPAFTELLKTLYWRGHEVTFSYFEIVSQQRIRLATPTVGVWYMKCLMIYVYRRNNKYQVLVRSDYLQDVDRIEDVCEILDTTVTRMAWKLSSKRHISTNNFNGENND